MGWPHHIPHDESPVSHDTFVHHLVNREALIGLGIVTGIAIIAVILASILFPKVALIAAFFYFAYIILFTLPMWVGLFEDDIEEETRRHDHPDERQ